MAKIVTVYSTERRATTLIDMSYIRWLKISEALAALGHQVDMATAEFKWRLRKPVVPVTHNLRRVPISRVEWDRYDVVKTLFHRGFQTLKHYRGTDHPFIISKLGSVVGPTDIDGIYFYGSKRERLFSVQEEINDTSRYVTVLSEPARQLWHDCFGPRKNMLLVPGAADAVIPPPHADPYPHNGRTRCVFAGNFYDQARGSQAEAHLGMARKLTMLGRSLSELGIRLYVVGPGDARNLDDRYVTYCGVTSYDRSWDYMHFADVGVVVAAGSFMHNNESSKIYHYLRAGLPVVSEAGFPNDSVVTDSRLGFVVENGNPGLMAAKVLQAAREPWDRAYGARYILEHHTWTARAEVYDRIIRQRV